MARPRMAQLIPVAAMFLLLAGASGAVFYYNAHVVNEFRTAKEKPASQRRITKSYTRNMRAAAAAQR